MKDTKSILKEAREAIKNKHYDTSLKLCRQILNEEKNNYMALVFLGVSLQETGQLPKALSAFQDAIQANPSNCLAWNGLINYYEKVDTRETKRELINAYMSLLNIEVGEKKLLEYAQKICNLCEYGDTSEITLAIYSLVKSGKCSEVVEVAICLVNILSTVKNVSSELLPIYEEALKILLNSQKTICTKYYADYLNLLYRLEKFEEVVEHAKKMHTLFETDSVSLRWICKIFNECYIESDVTIEKEDIATYCEALLKLENQSATALFTKSILLVERGQLIEAKEILDRVVCLLPGLVHAWVLLLKSCIKLLFFSEALQVANKIDKLLQSSSDSKKKLKKKVDIFMIEVLSRSGEEDDLKRVTELYESLDSEMKNICIYHIIRTNINLKNYSKAKLLLGDLEKSTENQAMCKLLTAQLLHKQEKYVEALELLQVEDSLLSEWWIEMGTLYWDAGQYGKSLMPFLKATKLDSSNYKCFLLLGHYYKRNNDFDKARRCYEKAFKINTRCSEAGIELSKIYRKLKNWDANLTLLQALTSGIINKRNCWAWMQLGLHYLEQQEYDKAIANLRFVIRVDESNTHCWESLADAYLAKGAYTSALKCYEKTSSLSQEALYPLLQMAHIKQILGEFTEARLDFEEILKSNKFYVPALKGMAETCLLQAKDCFRDQRLGTSRDYAQIAADNLIIAIEQRSDLACLWKLLGDSCLFVTNLPEKYCCLLLLSSFVEGKDVSGNKILEKNELYTLASRCYCKSLSFIEDNFLIWHDLAVCYLNHAINSDTQELFQQLINKALAIAQYCTSKNSTYWQHWNLLGNIAMNLEPPNYRLAQHSFIKAVIADNNSAVSWSNLGTLYFMLEEYKLANEAFSQAQRSDPNYVNSWIGQALLAETLTHEDAMDLFRHSTQLRIHKQGALGYAHWVCKTLKESPVDAIIYSIHNMHAIPVACDAMTWYTEHNPMDGTAWNMLGILKERMGLKLGALEAFRNALSLSKENNRDFCRVNYGRLLARLGKYSQAIDMFTKIEAATFNSGSGLALTLFKDEHYKESYEAYESTLHWLSEEPQLQSDLLVALASMAYMFEGPEAAKTLLFQSIQLEKPSPWGFYSTLSLGLLHSDFNLAKLVLTELQRLKDRKDCLEHFGVLSCYFHLSQKNSKSAIREVSKIVHRHPDQAAVWLTLSSLLIRLQDERSKAAAKCAQIAMKLGQTNMDVTKVLCLVALAFFIVGDSKNALLMAQKAVHCYPDVAEGWAIFSAAVLSAKKLRTSLVRDILKFAENLNSSEGLSKWLQKIIRSL
jgi:superkiller protein 3